MNGLHHAVMPIPDGIPGAYTRASVWLIQKGGYRVWGINSVWWLIYFCFSLAEAFVEIAIWGNTFLHIWDSFFAMFFGAWLGGAHMVRGQALAVARMAAAAEANRDPG